MPDLERHRRLRASDADRDAVLAVLHKAYAAGRLDTRDLSERQELVLSSRFIDELPDLVADVPEGASLQERWRPVAGAARAGAPALTDAWTTTILTGRSWEVEPGTTVRNFSLLGGDTIRLHRALGPGVTLVMDLPTIMGGHTLLVPPGVRVVEETQGIMGGNTVRKSAQGDGSQGTLVLRGALVMGGHTVKLDRRR